MAYYKRTACRLCDSSSLLLALHYPPQPLADEYLREQKPQDVYPLDLYLCESCGCAQLLDVVSADTIYPHYTYQTGSSPALAEHFRQYAIDVDERVKPPRDGLIIDIGGNDGTLLDFFRLSGMKLINVDPAPIANSDHIKRYYQFLNPSVANMIYEDHGPASIVTANNVFANIDELRTFTETVRNLLTKDGVFVFETFYLGDFIGNMVFDFIYHEHLTAFSVAPLIGFFQRLGMELYDVQRVPTKGGSIRCYVQLEGGRRKVEPIVASLVELEYIGGLHRGEVFKQFAKKIEKAKRDLHQWFSTYNAIGETVVGYGASPTSTTLLYSLELGNIVHCLIDDWPNKQGTFSPGLHLPVHAPKLSREDAPFYCIVLAWRYWREIIERNPNYRGTWIVPLPELRIIEGHVVERVMLARAHRAMKIK